MKEALSSSETSVLTRATRRNITEGTILHSHRRENLKSYINHLVIEDTTLLPRSLVTMAWPVFRLRTESSSSCGGWLHV
jgi:hypothetical protein